jgi:Zn-dependent metalloprotease
MKKNYVLFVLALFLLNGPLRAQNAFDARVLTKKTNAAPSAVLQQAGVIDGRQSTSPPRLVANPGPLVIEGDLKQNRFRTAGVNGSQLPTVIYRNPKQQYTPTQNATGEAFTFLKEVKRQMHITDPDAEFVVTRIETDDLNMTHVRLQQQFHSVAIYGAEVILHGSNGYLDYLNGNYVATPELGSTIPSQPAAAAFKAMKEHIVKLTTVEELTALQKQILQYESVSVQVVILPITQGNTTVCKLAYRILVRPNFLDYYAYFIDANDLSVLNYYNMTCSANGPRTASATDLNGTGRTINTYEFNGTFYCLDASKPMFNAGASTFPDKVIGAIQTFNANNSDGSSLFYISNTTNTGWNATATSAHFNAGAAFDYFKTTFSRNSINGTGGTITSIINVTQNGSAMDNAYWNGAAMFYGNGNTAFKPLAGSMDVAGHEMTHGVVQATANLEYQSQPGAINESMADVFGCMMDKADWKVGEDITKTSYISTGCLRDMSNPHNGNGNGYQPAKMSEYDPTTSDNGGVHINSGIPNHAYYFFATSVTTAKAELVYYRALTMYLTKTSKFLDLRYAVVKAATDIYGASSSEVTAAKSAFDQVEIFDPNGNTGGGTGGGTTQTTPDDLPVNPGADFILSYDLSGAPSKLYRCSTTGTNYVGITATDQNRRVTLPDNGSYCLYVDLNNDILKVDLTASPYTETNIYNFGDMENVSISKDGKLLAAVSTSIDTAIYIYNFALATWKKIKLYNPTYAGVNSGGVNYADGLEWDNTGQYVIYDAHNVVKNNSGTDLTYWDVGIVKVWDLKTNTWGDGKIEKLFTNLDEGISIGNPIFSKNSPYIIAFDLIDNSGFSTDYGVLGTNIITNTTKAISGNTKLGFPVYSKTDNKILVDGEDANSDENIYVINLNADKISPNGGATELIPDGKWAYWYATGTRSLLSSAKDILAFSISNVNPAVTATISGTSITATVPSSTNLNALVGTFSLSYASGAKVGGTEQVSGLSINNFTNPVTYAVTAQDGSVKNYTVTITKASSGISGAGDGMFTVYPNPVGHTLNVNSALNYSYEVVDVSGKSLLYGNNFNGNTISTGSLAQGIYFLKLSTAEGVRVIKFERE